ncbi:MAG: cation-translocating P-type ATPase, partial [Gammaproteobacteria bacterium]|nr:cation-translocating P-type ATPase [Gammaproteobacteria bacterium]
MNQASNAAAAEPLQVKIDGMDCGSCAMTIENSMRKLPGVNDVSVSFTTESMEIDGDVSVDDVEARLKELGYRIAVSDSVAATDVIERRGLLGFVKFLWVQPTLRLALIVTAVVIVGALTLGGLEPIGGLGPLSGLDPLALLFAAAVLIAGAPVFVKGLRALIFARRITIDLLMAVACVGALGIGEMGEAVTVILLFMLGEALEAYSAERARDSLRSLMALQPQEATVLRAHSDTHGHDHDDHDHGHEAHDHQVVLPVEQVKVGDRVLVRPAQRIPVDGEVISGTSSVNQAPVTGESVPVRKTVEDEVMAGTVNGEAALELRVTRPAADGTIARIAKLVEQAQAQRSPAERFIDRFARWYTPAVVLFAVLAVAIPVLAFGQPFLDTADGTRGWLYRGLTLLIIACPCALVISIPVTVVSGLTRLANLGVLVKGGAQLDRTADIQVIAFDKTGTLTVGRPEVTNLVPLGVSETELLALAAAVEARSEHPLAEAIVAEAEKENIRNLEASEVSTTTG